MFLNVKYGIANNFKLTHILTSILCVKVQTFVIYFVQLDDLKFSVETYSLTNKLPNRTSMNKNQLLNMKFTQKIHSCSILHFVIRFVYITLYHALKTLVGENSETIAMMQGKEIRANTSVI